MKKALLLLLAASLFSCGEQEKSQEEIIKEKASVAIQKNMNDPKSYEFVSIDKIDTIVWSDKEGQDLMLQSLTTEQENREAFVDSVQNIIEQRKSNSQFHFIDVNVTIRGNNANGAKILTDYYVKFDKDYNVVDVKQNN